MDPIISNYVTKADIEEFREDMGDFQRLTARLFEEQRLKVIDIEVGLNEAKGYIVQIQSDIVEIKADIRDIKSDVREIKADFRDFKDFAKRLLENHESRIKTLELAV